MLSQNNNFNKLDHIYLMILKGSMGLYVKETIRVSFRHLQENNKPASGLFCAMLHYHNTYIERLCSCYVASPGTKYPQKLCLLFSFRCLERLRRFLLTCVKNPFLSERSELKGFSKTIKIVLVFLSKTSSLRTYSTILPSLH